jgi:ABC-type sulfate transport system permease component
MPPIAVIDFETTGMSPAMGARATEIAAVLIVSRLEEFAYREAAAVAVVMLGFSFVLLVLISLAERWSQPHAK